MTTKLNKLTKVRKALLECRIESVSDEEEFRTLINITQTIEDLILKERHKEGHMAIYQITDSTASELLYEGTPEECDIYTEILFEGHPEMKGNIIRIGL